MSHCTRFKFQYTDKNCIRKTFANLGLRCEQVTVRTSGDLKWRVDEYPSFRMFSPSRLALAAKKNGFNYFMEDMGGYYALSMEKHNMDYDEARQAQTMSNEFQRAYVEEIAQQFVTHLKSSGTDCFLEKQSNGFAVRFGPMYEKSILIKFENGRVIEEVQGVKGQSCTSITEALENMLSSSSAEMETEWTSEYYEEPEGGLEVYGLEQI